MDPPKAPHLDRPILGGERAARGGERGGPDEGLLERGARGGERGCVGARGGREGARGSKQILTWTGGERGREGVGGGERGTEGQRLLDRGARGGGRGPEHKRGREGARGKIRFIGIKSTSTP